MILDPTYTDFFTKKLSQCLATIGNPVIARDRPNVRLALGDVGNARRAPTTAAAEALWSAGEMATVGVERDLTGVRERLTAAGLSLNESQWRAWDSALHRRLRLLWGPPGAGKTRTLHSIALERCFMLNTQAGLFASWFAHPHTRLWTTFCWGSTRGVEESWATTAYRYSGFARLFGRLIPTSRQTWMSA